MLDRKNRQTPSAGRRELWQLLVLLLLVIVLPTVCLLWFMTAAVANERMAVRQKLTDLYRAQLEEANIRLAAFSGSLASELDRGGVGPVAYFEEIVSSDIADSVIVFAPQVGGGSSCLYPCVTAFDLAADSFEGPVAALYEQLSELRRLHRTDRPRANTLAKSLSDALRSYGDSGVTSAQRLFLMQEILALDPSQHFPTRHAEQIALAYVDGTPKLPSVEVFEAVGLGALWQFGSRDGLASALFNEARLISELNDVIQPRAYIAGMRVEAARKGSLSNEREFLIAPCPACLPDWELRLFLDGPDPFATAARKQVTIYVWTGILMVLLTTALATVVIQRMLKQLRVTRLKNDFIATVTHELKTPLASMRLLVDTLLEGTYNEEKQAREYLELIAKENKRLSRLIDNFLTFSRMERNKKAFHCESVDPSVIVETAVSAVQGRFDAVGCRLDVEVAGDLPGISADPDAMTTVVLNLLDNAYKYSTGERRIVLRVYEKGDKVCFAVRDNGVGLSKRDQRRVFERFYQVDQSLARKTPGVGLGLSIVKFIVAAHGGTLEIESEVGEGSTFLVGIPAES